MAAGPKLDGAGTAKMATLEDALPQLQKLHGVVENLAMAVRNNQPTLAYGPQLKRVGTPLVGLLKAQFGLLSDQVAAIMLIATRGGGDQLRVRALREGVAQLRTALEIQIAQVKAKHTVPEKEKAPAGEPAS